MGADAGSRPFGGQVADMQSVYKYSLIVHNQAHVGEYVIPMSQGAKILCAQAQYRAICLWALVDRDAPLVERKFKAIMTGELIPEPNRLAYIGTVQFDGGALVVHIFEDENPDARH